jgi:tetratricopeptide (TPR) repeat protein
LEFIYEKQLFPELEYIFKHALTQEVAYNTLLGKRKREIHQKIGEAIESLYSERLEEHYELLAYHYVRSENKVKAVEYLDLANRKAAKTNALEEAKAYFDQGMQLLDELPGSEENRERRISLLVNQWIVFFLLFRGQEYYELLTHYEPMAAMLGNHGLQGAFYSRLGQCALTAGFFDKAIQIETKAAELCEAAGNAEDAGYAYRVLQWGHVFKGDLEKALCFKEDVFDKMGKQFDLRTYVYALGTASMAYVFLGRWNESEEEGQKALRIAREFSDNSLMCWAAVTISAAFISKRNLDRAIEYAKLAVARASTPADEVLAQAVLAWAWCHTGEPDKGLKLLAELVQVYRTGRYVPGEILWGLILGDGYLLAGQYEQARETIEEIMGIAEKAGARWNIGYAHRLLGEISLKTSPEDAALLFEKAISIFKEIKAENELALAYSGMGRYHKQQRNTAQAKEYLTKALEIFERLGTLIEPDKVQKELAELGD